jgi:hypothetical protein
MTPAGKPAWSREAAIGDYGGSLDKRDSDTEGTVPYAWFCYRELIAIRGSAYSGQLGGTLVHCENLALARVLAHRNFRCPEKFAANSLPGSADEGLDYWVKVLAVPSKPTDQKWELRKRAAAHYKAATGTTISAIRTALQDLLGDIFVDATFNEGTDLATPPTITYWPGVNPGDSGYSLGGGTWASERSHLYVEVQQPAGASTADLDQLINVQAFQLLDRMLPAYVTFSVALGGGFALDIDQLDYTGVQPG